MKGVELKNDNPFEQEWALFQFASKKGKYSKGETIGIKLCGGFKTEEEMNKKAEELYNSGQIYFKMEPQKIGQWLSFPDYSKDTRDEKEFVHSKANNVFGNTFDLNEMYANNKKNSGEKDTIEQSKKETIKQSTYYYQPETKEDLEHLIELILVSLRRYHDDYNFFKQALTKSTKDYHEAKSESEIQETEEDIETYEDNDYLGLSRDPSSSQKYALFSFAHESSRQKSSTFSFKVRGVFTDMVDFEKRKTLLFKEDPLFDIYKFPVGEWVPFNSEEAQDVASYELNKVVGSQIKKQLKNKKEFERRVKNLGKDESDNTVYLTKEDIKKNMTHCVTIMKETKVELEEYKSMLEKNIAFYVEKWEVIPEDLSLCISDILAFESNIH